MEKFGTPENTPEKPEILKDDIKSGFINFGYESEKSDANNGDRIDNSSTEKKNVDFDDLIPHFGSFGRYQLILFLLLGPYTLFYVFVYFTQIFIILVPNDYWCHVPELQHLELSDR